MAFGLTDIPSRRVIQQDTWPSGKADVAVAWTYTVAASTVEARVYLLDGTLWKDWTAVTISSQTAGVGAGILPAVNAVTVLSWFKISLRFDGGAAIDGTNRWGIGEVIPLSGSSTLSYGCNTTVGFPDTNALDCTSVFNSTQQLAASCTINDWVLPYGPFSIPFANTMATVLQVPVGLVNGAIANSKLSEWGGASPLKTNNLRDIVIVATIGTNAPRLCLANVGSNDARIVPPGVGYLTDYASTLALYESYLAKLRVFYGSTLKIGVLGSQISPTDSATTPATSTDPATDVTWGYLNETEWGVSQETGNFLIGFNKIYALSSDNIHVSAPVAYRQFSVQAARAVLTNMFSQTYFVTFSQMTSAVYTSATGVMDVTFNPPVGRKLSTATGVLTGVTGFAVSNDNRVTFEVITSAVVTGRTTVRLQLPTGLATPKVEYMYGHNPTVRPNYLISVVDS